MARFTQVPQLATWTCCRRLVELEEVMERFLENAMYSFCLRDDDGKKDDPGMYYLSRICLVKEVIISLTK